MAESPPASPPDDAGQAEVAPETIAEIERLADDLAGQPDRGDLARRLEWLVEVLIQRGHLKPGHGRLLARIRNQRSTVHLKLVDDKRSTPSPDIDCASLLPLCKGRCCSFTVYLSPEDIEEGTLRWDLNQPYTMTKDPITGYCCNARPGGGCGVYHERPSTCRSYDCRDDRRVWLDYANRLAAPMPESVIAIDEWPDRGPGT